MIKLVNQPTRTYCVKWSEYLEETIPTEKHKEIRLPVTEYLTPIAANGDNQEAVEIRYEDENIWLTQEMVATLYDVSTVAINQHLRKIFDDNELQEEAAIKNSLIVQEEDSRDVSRGARHCNLQAITAVGFKVNNERVVQFKKWANQIVKDFTIRGWAMDDERFESSDTKFTKDYPEKLLVKIHETRLPERRFYQKITDIYATSLSYDPFAEATKRFFATIQNKLHYAIHGKTAAELIVDRADHKNKNVGFTTWEGSPDSKIYKYDIIVAENYLNEEELNQVQRIVSSYLDMAGLRAERHIPMTMEDWEKRLNGFLRSWDKGILSGAGKVSAALTKKYAESEFEKYRIIQDRLCKSDFDKFLELEEDSKKLKE